MDNFSFFVSSLDVAEFDNSFSYLRSKKIWYSIKITAASSPTVSEML